MSAETLYLFGADAILISHFLFVAFVVLGLIFIYAGKFLAWAWVRSFRFRVLHLAAITVVVLQSWLGAICPLTLWEMQLRAAAGQAAYEGSFIQYWFRTLLYYEAPDWVFVLGYTLFGALVVASWFIVRPKHRR